SSAACSGFLRSNLIPALSARTLARLCRPRSQFRRHFGSSFAGIGRVYGDQIGGAEGQQRSGLSKAVLIRKVPRFHATQNFALKYFLLRPSSERMLGS